jgi:hypothetical protein
MIQWFTWEDNFMEKISAVRKRELQSLRAYVLCDTVLRISYSVLPTFVGVATFLIHTQVNHINAANIS